MHYVQCPGTRKKRTSSDSLREVSSCELLSFTRFEHNWKCDTSLCPHHIIIPISTLTYRADARNVAVHMQAKAAISNIHNHVTSRRVYHFAKFSSQAILQAIVHSGYASCRRRSFNPCGFFFFFFFLCSYATIQISKMDMKVPFRFTNQPPLD